MTELSKSQRARHAIRTFNIIADSLPLRGSYHPSGTTGSRLADALIQLSPEIYGTMTDPRMTELKGLEYVIDRMPKGIENCTRIVFTGQEDFEDTSFEKIIPLRRRRVSYAVSANELCFVLTTGTSEIYDILSHLTFLHIEAEKIYRRIVIRGEKSIEWQEFAKIVSAGTDLTGGELEQALWNLSIILGRTYKETRESYYFLESSRNSSGSNNGLFNIIYGIVERIIDERENGKEPLIVYFTPSLHDMINNQKYAMSWAENLKRQLLQLGFIDRRIHVVSANMHSMRNLVYGAGALAASGQTVPKDLFEMVRFLRGYTGDVEEYAKKSGYSFVDDLSGSAIDVHIIDLAMVDWDNVHPSLQVDRASIEKSRPVIVVMDYAFGTQAFDVMDQLLEPMILQDERIKLNIESISIMGKAGILPGGKGDIMLATSHVLEGTGNSYIMNNDITADSFPEGTNVFCGPMLTVLGTSLQNRDVLERFYSSDWKVVGLEMEGGHYQKAIEKAVIQKRIPSDISVRYAYYASDNPMISGQTLASGPMGEDGIQPTYQITKIFLEKICNQ